MIYSEGHIHGTKYMETTLKTFFILIQQVTKMLTGLDQFLKRIEPEIESIRGNERDTASFMKMMRLFNEVTAQQQVVTIYMIYWFEIYGTLRDEDMHRIKLFQPGQTFVKYFL